MYTNAPNLIDRRLYTDTIRFLQFTICFYNHVFMIPTVARLLVQLGEREQLFSNKPCRISKRIFAKKIQLLQFEKESILHIDILVSHAKEKYQPQSSLESRSACWVDAKRKGRYVTLAFLNLIPRYWKLLYTHLKCYRIFVTVLHQRSVLSLLCL